MTDHLIIPPDRTYGTIEITVLKTEHAMRKRGLRMTVENLVGYAGANLPEPEDGKRDKREYQARRALGTLTGRSVPDLEIRGIGGDAMVERTVNYMVPKTKAQLSLPDRDPLNPRSGHLTDRINGIDWIVAEELVKLKRGEPFNSFTPEETHMLLAVIGDKLLDSMLPKIRAAVDSPDVHRAVSEKLAQLRSRLASVDDLV